jgi:hypothetical protein
LEIAVLKVILPENAAAHSLSSLVPLSPLTTPSGREGVVTIIFYSAVTTRPIHHHHQPINVPTAGAQAFLMDTHMENGAHYGGRVLVGG